jgi:hypothetical protein
MNDDLNTDLKLREEENFIDSEAAKVFQDSEERKEVANVFKKCIRKFEYVKKRQKKNENEENEDNEVNDDKSISVPPPKVLEIPEEAPMEHHEAPVTDPLERVLNFISKKEKKS